MNRPSAAALAVDAAEALCAWENGYKRGARGVELRRLRLTYYDLRWELERRLGWTIASRLIEAAVCWPEVLPARVA